MQQAWKQGSSSISWLLCSIDSWSVSTWQYWKQALQRKNYSKSDHRQMWPTGSFTSVLQALIYKPPFLAQWLQQSGTRASFSTSCWMHLTCFSTHLKLKWMLKPALQIPKMNILMSQALVLYEELNQLLPEWFHSQLFSRENSFL